MTGWDRAALAGGALLLALAGGMSTHALWTSGDGTVPGAVTAGDFDVALDGGATWTDISPDVTPRAVDPDRFRAMPGDVVVMRQDIVTTLVGENAAAELTVRWGERAAQVPGDVTATYRVLDAAGAQVTAPAAVGQSVTVPVPAAGEKAWTVSLVLAVAPGAPAYAAAAPPAGVPLADLGDLVLQLDQVRAGGRFSS
ncbi:alternate-type signal peptide domain-containing protein [Georgenia faecalis]|uniref:alternate-type signal peptide domain-containing protein n=1 Tax=Georgenia faecalis TaxID=2483799 RepID=UPI000FD70931|nr:alternate-type signal peptide domain-containing protein [Georgenia faecalis]